MDESTRSRLRSPRGQLELLAVTLVLAIAFAVFLTYNRSLFERYVCEKYPPPSIAIQQFANDLVVGGARERVAVLSEIDLAGLYSVWMSERPTDSGQFASALFAVRPAYFLNRVERTLVAGDREQRRRALQLLEVANRSEALPLLRWAEARAQRMRNASLATELRAAIARLSP